MQYNSLLQSQRNNLLLIPVFILIALMLGSCSESQDIDRTENRELNKLDSELTEDNKTPNHRLDTHPYGGWYCPDNIIGFPAVDVADIDKIEVVKDRLPSKEETLSGKSLIHVDLKEYPTAKALDLGLPKLARFYNPHTLKDELVIVIQAIEVDNDSVVGFRYLNGGNGSSWYEEVQFFDDKEIAELTSTPFVQESIEINASNKEVWEVITGKEYAKDLGDVFGEGSYIESDWREFSEVNFMYGPDNLVSSGIVTASWENLYIQVDYNFDGYHYVEKYLILENEKNQSVDLHLLAGPYAEDYQEQIVVWNTWLKKVSELSESIP